MWNAEHTNHHRGNYISASSLSSTSCARQTWFERNFGFYETPRRRFWPFRGTVCHALIEGSGPEAVKYGWMQEIRMAVVLEFRDMPAPLFDEDGSWTGEFDSIQHLVITLGGTCDAYNYRTLDLHDYKTIGDAKVGPFLKGKSGGQWSPNIKDDWVLQTNIYRWMIGRTRVDDVRWWFDLHNLPVPYGEFLQAPERISMQLVSMMEIPLTGTTYVPQRSIEGYEIGDVPVLDDAEMEAFIRTEVLRWYRWLVLGEKPPVVEQALSWMCKSCQFNGDVIFGERCHPDSERKAEVVETAIQLPLVAVAPDDPYGIHTPSRKAA